MIRIIKIFMVAILILATNVMTAQDFQGIATYKSKRQMNLEMDSTQVNSEMQERMMEMLKKQFEKTYVLTFNKEESVFKEEAQLEAPQAANITIVVAGGGGGSDELYKNTKENRFVSQNDSYGKVFLIRDELEKQDWKLGSETKNIGDYTCYKATLTRERPVSRDLDEDEEIDETAEREMEEYVTTAWYTPQIPVNNGPRRYFGLPGLILEINDGSETMICSKIVLNSKDKLNISEPTKGKKVSQTQFDEIMQKKRREMRERFRNEREHSDDGNQVRIRVRG